MYKNKNILVTGTSRGVGFDIACHFLKNGANVIGLSRGKANIEDKNYYHYSVDLGDPDSIVSCFKNYISKSQDDSWLFYFRPFTASPGPNNLA